MRTTRTAILVLGAALACGAAAQAPVQKDSSAVDEKQDVGTICVLPNPEERPSRISPGDQYNPATLTVRIDKGERIPWPHKRAVRIENLSLKGRHLIVLTSDGKQIKSLWFRFSNYREAILCLNFDGYQGVQLGDKRTALWCRCK
jgi:hypothetical protein